MSQRASSLIIARFTAIAATLLVVAPGVARQLPSPVSARGETLNYATSERGDRVPDFSAAGYRGGGVPIPTVPARVAVAPADGDDGARIQAAIDYVSKLPADNAGIRGAVHLAPGRFEIRDQVKIRTTGVVLRGSGSGADGTVLVATGTGRRALIEIAGTDDRRPLAPPVGLADEYVPVGATQIRVSNAGNLSPGTRIVIERPSPPEWIKQLGMDETAGRQPYTWKPGAFDVRWNRTVVEVKGDTVTLDAPLTTALEKRFGGGTIQPEVQQGYIENCGVENLRCESEFDRANPLDEQHAWNAIDLHGLRDGWVSDVTAIHFASSAVQVGAKVERVTVQDCASLAPVSELAGYRRMAFHTRGQGVLFLRCVAEKGGNDFTAGYLAAGPNVFLACKARETHGFSGSVGSWASGLLFDGVDIDGGSLRIENLETWNQGVGWSAANSMIWDSSAAVIVCRTPPGAANWAVGVWGQFLGNGHWSAVNEYPSPRSLYRAQLQARLGAGALAALDRRDYPKAANVRSLDELAPDWREALRKPAAPELPLAVQNGWLTVGGRLLAGGQATGAWWLGRLEPARASETGPALTRFAPGRTGTGLTDEIPSVAAGMQRRGEAAFRHHYGLWYERRRIDHQMIRRPDADVYPPFFEQPFARSGKGTAWDGMSRYDLTRYNPWYFDRLHAFAVEARQRGLVLVNEMYFQHNIIESGAHWVDSPWRPMNNVNQTDFTEPPPFTGDTIKMADEFYDVSHPVRRELHRLFIRQCLAALADEPNVIHTISAENTGPLHFMQFWLDVAAEWERETGRHPLLALSATKDVQDAILADPKRAALIDVIDFLYWWQADDALYAPRGGISLAPRQNLRLWKGGKHSAASLAGMVRDYRSRFPEKPIMTGLSQPNPWAFLAAGGSIPTLPADTPAELLAALPHFRPGKDAPSSGVFTLVGGDRGAFVFAFSGGNAPVDLTGASGEFVMNHIDLSTGRSTAGDRVRAGAIVNLSLPAGRPAAVWLSR